MTAAAQARRRRLLILKFFDPGIDPMAMTLDRLLRQAIAQRRLISFHLRGQHRIAEPHDYGIHKGRLRLFFYQVGGASSSGGPLGWRWAEADQMSQLQLLDETFEGARGAPSGQHIAWDQLYASVADRRNAYPD